MMQQRSSLSFTAIPELRQDVRVEEDGDIFSKTVKTTVDWYAKPHWLAGGPLDRGGPAAFTTAFKVAGCNPANDPEDQCIARAGVSFLPFDGGNMPSAEYKAASFSQEESGFTFLLMIVITVVLAWATAGAALAVMGAEAGAAGAAGLTAAEYAGISGAVYAVGSGGGNLTSAQPQWFGSVGDGQITPQASGSWADPTQAVNNTWVQPELQNTQGGLNQYWQTAQPKTSDYVETNGVLLLREGTPIQNGIMNGITQP